MPPIHSFSNWDTRASDEMEPREPFRKYFIICEGANTETYYFEKLISLRKELGINPTVELIFLEKTGKHHNLSYPKHLIEFANAQKVNKDLNFDKTRDYMIIVFDTDIYEKEVDDYKDVIALGNQDKSNILAITNPSFELFLLLHYKDSYENDISPNRTRIIENNWEGNHRPIYNILKNYTQMNSKTNFRIGELAQNVDIAIQQEKKINQDIYNCNGNVTSNIGKIIDSIRNDQT